MKMLKYLLGHSPPPMAKLEDRWYWDRRTNKAYYPIEIGEDTTTFITVWHREEIADALRSGVVSPIEEIGHERTATTFDLIDSFRLPPDPDSTRINQ